MTLPATALDNLRRGRPEWRPWLAVVEEALRETTASKWESAVPDPCATRAATDPLLAGTTITVQGRSIRRLLHRVIRLASSNDTPKMASLRPVTRADVDIPALFAASLRQDDGPVAGLARSAGADAEALQAVVSLVSMPFLHACRRRWTSVVPPGWVEGYCPVCGSWPAFVEDRGIERSRFFRCGRCGGEWYARLLQCPFCAVSDHDELVSLVPESGAGHAALEACRRCLGYVKVFTKLQGCAPAAVILEDLASVHLDVAAVAAGYRRPAGAGSALEITVGDQGATRGLFAWNT